MNIGAFPRRGTGHKSSMRTVKELADEFGVEYMVLARALKCNDAPKRVAKYSNATGARTYFNADDVRAWWLTYLAKQKI